MVVGGVQGSRPPRALTSSLHLTPRALHKSALSPPGAADRGGPALPRPFLHLPAPPAPARAISEWTQGVPRPPAAQHGEIKGSTATPSLRSGAENFTACLLGEGLAPHPGLIEGPGVPKGGAPAPSRRPVRTFPLPGPRRPGLAFQTVPSRRRSARQSEHPLGPRP